MGSDDYLTAVAAPALEDRDAAAGCHHLVSCVLGVFCRKG